MIRRLLSTRRHHQVLEFEFWGISFVVGIGRDLHDDPAVGPIQELFINSGKTGTQMDTMSRDAAVLISIALQHGVPIETMKHAVTRNVDASASGPIGALLDLLALHEASK